MIILFRKTIKTDKYRRGTVELRLLFISFVIRVLALKRAGFR